MEDHGLFNLSLLAWVATIAGIWAPVQNYRNRRSVPRLGL
jgi:hypothetical protein